MRAGWWGWVMIVKSRVGTGRASKFAIGLVLVTIAASAPAAGAQSEEAESPLVLGQPTAESATSSLAAAAAVVEPGFTISPAIQGLNFPTFVRFSPDGRVFVAEKGGQIKVYSSLQDSSPDVAINLAPAVYSFWDRGLLGMALDPAFPTSPYLYLLYTHDFVPYNDGCPSPPGATTDGCLANARLSRVQIQANNTASAEQVLLGGQWCQQYPSHTVGALEFGADGALYASAGDGASFTFTDFGQGGGSLSGTPTPKNPCGDPPVPVGGNQQPPSAEGGALRSQDLRTPNDPVSFHGAVLRVDPATGNALPSNPLFGGSISDDDRIVAYGLRNPFRFTVRPGTSELWIGDVGWNVWEEINRIANPTSAVTNFGWPCYEGGFQSGSGVNLRESAYDGANLSICETLYSTSGAVTAPFFAWQHGVTLDGCPENPSMSSAVSGLAFYPGGSYPANFDGALFFSDYSRACIWVMFPGSGGTPNPGNVQLLSTAAPAVGLQAGPGGDIFYVDHIGGAIMRISSSVSNGVPTAVLAASPTSGTAPLTVNFNGSGSTDPDSNPLSYAWDLDGDGQFDDATTATTQFTYQNPGSYQVSLQVNDGQGGTDTEQTTITVNSTSNSPPVADITAPLSTQKWSANNLISFAGGGTDVEDGTLPATAMSWLVTLQHCAVDDPGDCHAHPVQSFDDVSSGTFSAPEHDYPSWIQISLTVTDSGGATGVDSVRIDPETVILSFQSQPSWLTLVVGGRGQVAPFDRVLIQGSSTSITATSPQNLGSSTYAFTTWSDTGAQTHNILATSTPRTYTASYSVVTPQGDGYLDLPGVSGVNVSAPDAARLDVTGDLDIRADVAMTNWNTFGKLVAKLNTTSGYELLTNWTTGGLRLAWRNTAGSVLFRNSTVAIPATSGQRLQVRATLDVNNGASGHTVTFYYRTNTALSLADHTGWTQLGTPLTSTGATTIAAGTSPLVLGAGPDGAHYWNGDIYQAHILNGIGSAGTVVANPDFRTTGQLTSTPPNYSQWRDTPTNPYTVNGTGWTYETG